MLLTGQNGWRGQYWWQTLQHCPLSSPLLAAVFNVEAALAHLRTVAHRMCVWGLREFSQDTQELWMISCFFFCLRSYSWLSSLLLDVSRTVKQFSFPTWTTAQLVHSVDNEARNTQESSVEVNNFKIEQAGLSFSAVFVLCWATRSLEWDDKDAQPFCRATSGSGVSKLSQITF